MDDWLDRPTAGSASKAVFFFNLTITIITILTIITITIIINDVSFINNNIIIIIIIISVIIMFMLLVIIDIIIIIIIISKAGMVSAARFWLAPPQISTW